MLRPSAYAALGLGALALLGAAATRAEEDTRPSPGGSSSGRTSSGGAGGGAGQVSSVLEARDPNTAAAALREGSPIAGPGAETSTRSIETSGSMFRQDDGWGLYLGEIVTASGDPAWPFRSSLGYDFRLVSSSSPRVITRSGGRGWKRSNPIPWRELGEGIVWLVTFGAIKPRSKGK